MFSNHSSIGHGIGGIGGSSFFFFFFPFFFFFFLGDWGSSGRSILTFFFPAFFASSSAFFFSSSSTHFFSSSSSFNLASSSNSSAVFFFFFFFFFPLGALASSISFQTPYGHSYISLGWWFAHGSASYLNTRSGISTGGSSSRSLSLLLSPSFYKGFWMISLSNNWPVCQ